MLRHLVHLKGLLVISRMSFFIDSSSTSVSALGAEMPRGRLSSRAAASSLALAQLAAMVAWLSSAAFEAAFAYAAALFGGGYAGGGGGAGSGPCACLCAVRLAAQSRAIA